MSRPLASLLVAAGLLGPGHAGSAAAQVLLDTQDRSQSEERRAATSEARGGVLRTLDRMSGEVIDVEMAVGQTMGYGPLQVTLHECRFPTSNPAGDAYALIRVTEAGTDLFAGWMVASSPALNALEHRRYDVWLLSCPEA